MSLSGIVLNSSYIDTDLRDLECRGPGLQRPERSEGATKGPRRSKSCRPRGRGVYRAQKVDDTSEGIRT